MRLQHAARPRDARAGRRCGWCRGAAVSADKLLSRLDRVRERGRGQWSARCPAHDDRSPSLSVRELDDGRLLVHCFGGCDVTAVVGAVGLDLADLFPERDRPAAKAERRPWAAVQLLDLAAYEATIVVLITADMLAGREADRARLLEAVRRLGDVAEAAHGR